MYKLVAHEINRFLTDQVRFVVAVPVARRWLRVPHPLPSPAARQCCSSPATRRSALTRTSALRLAPMGAVRGSSPAVCLQRPGRVCPCSVDAWAGWGWSVRDLGCEQQRQPCVQPRRVRGAALAHRPWAVSSAGLSARPPRTWLGSPPGLPGRWGKRSVMYFPTKVFPVAGWLCLPKRLAPATALGVTPVVAGFSSSSPTLPRAPGRLLG